MYLILFYLPVIVHHLDNVFVHFRAGSTDNNTFSMGRAPTSNPQMKRQIKRAVRKIRK